jgi:endonuclease YncB( thermonuclease family)
MTPKQEQKGRHHIDSDVKGRNNLIIPSIILGTIIGLFLFLGILIDSQNCKDIEKAMPGKVETKIVTKIIDGDTVIIEGGESVRLLGIDCDEKGDRCYDEAKEYLKERIYEKEVKIISGMEDKDMYGRKLRYIFLDEININLEMVSLGYCASRFEKDTLYKKEISEAEKRAIEKKIGCKWD